MIQNYVNGEFKEETEYYIVYLNKDDINSGCGFPCDSEGNIKPLNEEAQKNLDWCRNNPDKFSVYGELETRKYTYKEPSKGVCHCGQLVILENQYYGACECPKCGQWYNMFGEELLPPEQWNNWDC